MSKIGITIEGLFKEIGKQLRNEFESIKSNNPHYGERGAETEVILTDFLNNHLPKRFSATSGLIVDNFNNISKQTDIIVYDSLNSPVYRKGPRVSIIPYDNVACIIEVKSLLTKDELKDAAQKISSVKRLKKTPISTIDQPVTFSTLINSTTMGLVFAYEAKTKLETLADNLAEINTNFPSVEWIDSIIVLDKGIISYAIQMPFSGEFPGDWGGPASENFIIPPYYIHLIKDELGELTLNKFFLKLMAHLTFYRKISTINFQSIIKNSRQVMTLNAYQYDLNRNLKPVDDLHKNKNLLPNLLRYNIYAKESKKYLGQVFRAPWQDGAFLGYSGILDPPLVFKWFSPKVKSDIIILEGGIVGRFWITNILPLNKEIFIEICEKITDNVFLEKDSDDNKMPWEKPKNN